MKLTPETVIKPNKTAPERLLSFEMTFTKMQTSQILSLKSTRIACLILTLGMAASVRPAAAEDTSARLQKAVIALSQLTNSSAHGIRPEEIAAADCVAVIPGFKKGAAVVGVSFGRGFISCRHGESWSAPGAVTLEGGSLGVQIGGEKIDIVILSMDKEKRSKLLSDRFVIGSDASAAWGNGKTTHGDANAKVLFFGNTKGVFAGFDLDGAALKPDDSGNQSLYGKPIKNSEVVESGTITPAPAQPLVSKLTSLLHSESAER